MQGLPLFNILKLNIQLFRPHTLGCYPYLPLAFWLHGERFSWPSYHPRSPGTFWWPPVDQSPCGDTWAPSHSCPPPPGPDSHTSPSHVAATPLSLEESTKRGRPVQVKSNCFVWLSIGNLFNCTDSVWMISL